MRKMLLVAALACLAGAAFAPPRPAVAEGSPGMDGPSDANATFRERIREGVPYGPRGLGGTTYTTSRVPALPPEGHRTEGPGGTGPLGATIFRDPRFQNLLLACDDWQPLEKIQKAFAEKEGRFWDSSLAITGFDRVRVIATNPWGQDNVPRRFCEARAHLSDGGARTVNYVIMEDQSRIGATWGVEWCVQGLDRGGSFDPTCRMARP